MPEKNNNVRRMPDGTPIRFEAREEVKAYRYELEEILDLIGFPNAFITDRSSPADFFVDGSDRQMNEMLQEISDHFRHSCTRAGRVLG